MAQAKKYILNYCSQFKQRRGEIKDIKMHYLCFLVMLDETMTNLWVLIVQSYFDLKAVLIWSLLRYTDGHAPFPAIEERYILFK